MMKAHSVMTAHVVNSASAGLKAAKNACATPWWRSVGLNRPTIAPVSTRILLIEMPLQRTDRVVLMFQSRRLRKPIAQPFEGGERRMPCTQPFMLQQQGDASFESLGFGEAMCFAVARQ